MIIFIILMLCCLIWQVDKIDRCIDGLGKQNRSKMNKDIVEWTTNDLERYAKEQVIEELEDVNKAIDMLLDADLDAHNLELMVIKLKLRINQRIKELKHK